MNNLDDNESPILAYNNDSLTEWVIEATPGFAAVKHKQGCTTCNQYAAHCMAAKHTYEIRLNESDIEKAVDTAWPHVGRNLDDYRHLETQYNQVSDELQEARLNAKECRVKLNQAYADANDDQRTIKALEEKVTLLETESKGKDIALLETESKGKGKAAPDAEMDELR